MSWNYYKETLTKEFLTQELIQNRKFIRQLAIETNISQTTILKYCKLTGIYDELKQGNPVTRFKDLTGRKFGKLLVIKQGKSDRFGKSRWECECKCGKTKLINSTSLLAKLTKTCGYCDRINFTGYKEISGTFWRRLKEKAKTHYNGLEITPEYIWKLYIKQNKCCALSGIPIKFVKNQDRSSLQTASIDRIDSSKGYIKGNVQIVHKRVNRIKAVLNNDEFIMWCKLIYLKHKDKADKLNLDLSKKGWNDR